MSVRLASRSFQYPVRIAENMLVEAGKFTFPADFIILKMEEDSKKQLNLEVGTERMIFNINSAMKHSYSNDFSIDVIDVILEEDFDAFLDEGRKILHSSKEPLSKKEIFSEFDEFMAMASDENSESESHTEELPFEKITINTDYKIKTSLKEPSTYLELKPLPDNLEYLFLEEPSFLPAIISSQLSAKNKSKLISFLNKHKEAFTWKTIDIPDIPFSKSHKFEYIIAVDYVSKCAEAQALPTNNARVVVTFFRKLFCHFGMPKALISDRDFALLHEDNIYSESKTTPWPIKGVLRRLTKRAIRIAQSKALSPAADEPASLSRDERYEEAFPTVSSLDAGQDRENIAKTSVMSHESSSRVPSLDADEEDAPITRGIIDIGEELGANKNTEKGSNNTKEMVNMLSSMEAANILSSRGATASVSSANVFPTAGVSTVSGSFPTVTAIFTTASVVTPYTRRLRGFTIRSLQPMRIPIISTKDKGKEKVTETEVPKKKKLQEQIDAQVARETEEEFARENQRLSEQVARDYEIARIHAEEELKLMIEDLDRSNEVIAKHLSEYEQAEADLSVEEKIELISELVKYQDHRAKILKYQAQQSKPLSKKEQREFYMSVLKSHAGWKTKHFRGMPLEQIKEKFILVWKQWEEFVPMSSKKEKPSQEQQFKGSEGVSEEEHKGMMQLVLLEEVYIEALQCTRDKEKELWVELKRLFKLDFEDQLWTYHQAFMHDPLDWKLYDTCGVHDVSTKNQEIFMLVEKEYPLRKGLATVMIIQDEELLEASSLGEHLIQET
nr:reverse transcriptase domain-containing protein [Tanacetum cinerariifolium]